MLVPRDLSENVDTRVELRGDRGEGIEVLALVLHDDGARADAAVTAAVDDPSIAAAVYSAATGDA